MTPDPFDQASRHLLRRTPALTPRWLLGLGDGEADFVSWLDASRVPWPGQPGRSCDTVAWLVDLAAGGLPWAVVVEFQTVPDAEMFGRLLVYLGEIWTTLRPSAHAGDRFCVGAVVVNLTGKGTSSRELVWQKAGLSTTLLVREIDLAARSAGELLDAEEGGQVPRAALAWLPLMQGGGEAANVARWLQLASQEPDAGKRADLGLVRVFAEAAGCQPVWDKALEGFNVIESKVVKEWKDQARAEGRRTSLLRLLLKKFGALPEDLRSTIEAAADPDLLDSWLEAAGLAGSLDDFRRQAGA